MTDDEQYGAKNVLRKVKHIALEKVSSNPDVVAVKWYRLAADQGYEYAQYNLGCMYEDGRGVKRSYKDAVKWYRLAADQGNARAQLHLGWMYEDGRGVEQSDIEAVKWYILAADQGQIEAKIRLDFIL